MSVTLQALLSRKDFYRADSTKDAAIVSVNAIKGIDKDSILTFNPDSPESFINDSNVYTSEGESPILEITRYTYARGAVNMQAIHTSIVEERKETIYLAISEHAETHEIGIAGVLTREGSTYTLHTEPSVDSALEIGEKFYPHVLEYLQRANANLPAVDRRKEVWNADSKDTLTAYGLYKAQSRTHADFKNAHKGNKLVKGKRVGNL